MNSAPSGSPSVKSWSTPPSCEISGLPTGNPHKRGVDAGDRIEVPRCAQAQAAEMAAGSRKATDGEPLARGPLQGDLDGLGAREHPGHLCFALPGPAGGPSMVQAIRSGRRACAEGSASCWPERGDRAEGMAEGRHAGGPAAHEVRPRTPAVEPSRAVAAPWGAVRLEGQPHVPKPP